MNNEHIGSRQARGRIMFGRWQTQQVVSFRWDWRCNEATYFALREKIKMTNQKKLMTLSMNKARQWMANLNQFAFTGRLECYVHLPWVLKMNCKFFVIALVAVNIFFRKMTCWLLFMPTGGNVHSVRSLSKFRQRNFKELLSWTLW